MLSPIPEDRLFPEDTGAGVLRFFSEEDWILAGFDSNDSATDEHPCLADIKVGPAQSDDAEKSWSFPLRRQGPSAQRPSAQGPRGLAPRGPGAQKPRSPLVGGGGANCVKGAVGSVHVPPPGG